MFPDKAPGGKYAWIDPRRVAGVRRRLSAAERANAGGSCGNAYMPLDTGRIARRMQACAVRNSKARGDARALVRGFR